MTYKGYTGAIEVDEDSGTLFGTVLGTHDIITFVGTTVEEARKSLQESVDFYLERCAATGQEPDKPFTGHFEVRVKSEVQRELEELAHTWKVDLNDVVAEALDRYLAANQSATYRAPQTIAKPKRREISKQDKDDKAARQAIQGGRASHIKRDDNAMGKRGRRRNVSKAS